MKRFLFIFLISIFGIFYSQKIVHIQYLNVRSPIANVNEDLYTDGLNVLSKQDGKIIFNAPGYDKGKTPKDFYFISKINSEKKDRDFFYTQYIENDNDYFIHDKVPDIKWSIDDKSSKKILGYDCFKATATFRGSPITAYYTKEIPYSVGPFKFFGLPGAILDVRVDGKNYDLWKAIKVESDSKIKIDFNPQFDKYIKIQMKDFAKLKDEKTSRFMNKAQVAGSTGKIVSLRFGVEKTFEWENESK